MTGEPTAGQPTDPQRQRPGVMKTVVRGCPLFLITLVINPVTSRILEVLQLASWPENDYPFAHRLFEATTYVIIVWLFIAVLTPILTLVLLVFRRTRRLSLVFFLVWLIAWVPVPINFQLDHLCDPGLSRITFAAQPLLKAIEEYQRDNGQLPPALDALVPTYLDRTPYTGAVGFPRFEYRLPNEYRSFKQYEVLVRTPSTLASHDMLIYWPEADYPLSLYGSQQVRPINDWAYVVKH
jgi:hypothetical protein